MDLGDGTSLVWSLVFGAIGTGYFMYGKKLQKLIPLGCGVGLMALPYFVGGVVPLVALGAALCVAPFVVR